MKVVGHRGAKGLAPENTVKAIEKALAYKVDEVEIDVRVSKDKVPVLIHSRKLTANNGSELKVSRSTYKELESYAPNLATLDEAIDAVKGKAVLYIEVKPRVDTAPIIQVVSDRLNKDCRPSDFLFASFSLKTLKSISNGLPNLKLVVNESWSGVRAGHRARVLKTDRISLNRHCLWSGYLKLATKRASIYAFTVNDPKQAAKLEKYGLDGIITDYPDIFKERGSA